MRKSVRDNRIHEAVDRLAGFCSMNWEVLEMLLTLTGEKKVCRQVLEEERLRQFISFCRDFRLYYELADFKMLARGDGTLGGFANEAEAAPTNHPYGSYILYVSKNKKSAGAAKLAERATSPEFGKILGYPGCCVDFHNGVSARQGKSRDFILDSLKRYGIYPFYNNMCLQHQGFALLSHFPCSPDCAASESAGKERLDFLREYFPALAQCLESELKSFVIYTKDSGVFYSTGFTMEGNMVTFGEIKGLIRNSLREKLQSAGKIYVTDFNAFTLDGEEYRGDCGIFSFK